MSKLIIPFEQRNRTRNQTLMLPCRASWVA